MSKTNDVLSSLTADRLEELAGLLERGIRLNADQAPKVAAVLRALAGAERAMLTDDTLSVEHGDVGEPPMPGFIAARDGIRVPRFGPLHPTLISALASVAKQEET